MTPEEQSPSPEDMRKVMRVMQEGMVNIALHDFERIGPRTFRVLEDLELINDEVLSIGDGLDFSVLRDPKHSRRQNLTDGPLVLYVTEGDEPKRMLVQLPLLFLSDDREVRQAALECIEKMFIKGPMTLTPKTVAIMNESRHALLSMSPGDWRPAAVAIYDALNDDTLLALRGTRQSLESEPVIQGSLNVYTPKVIHPLVTFLDSISLPIGNPERDHGTLMMLLTDMVARALNLAELCGDYLANLGFLPLAPTYSLASAVSQWFTSNPDVDLWLEVWEWANAESTPLSQYHACSIFVLFPELIPDGKLPELWNKILAVVQVQDLDKKEPNRSEYEPWALRRDLARHYTYHLEAHLPDNDGANIACFAWWFAEQVASILSANAGSAKFYRENWIKPALDLSSLVWLAASAPIQRSFLRYITLTVQSPWAVALMTLMGEHLDELEPSEQAEDVQIRFYEALVTNTLSSLPFPIKTPEDPVLTLECSFADTVLKWAEYQTEEHRKWFQQLVQMSQTLETSHGLCDALRTLSEHGLPDQAAVCIALKTKVYTDPTVAEGVWEVVSDAEWRKNVLGSVEHHVQFLLIESLSVLLVDNKDKWFSHLPHYIAELCEKEKDEEHRRVLFLYVIHTSLASDTVSAVCRLLRGDQKAKFFEYVKEYRTHVEAMRSNYPPWVAGKLRSLMASMHVL